ncbi:hypothetical protein JKP88DRAFT_250577 [Tribonema minus]|uniref:SnoaL-like domain-containing protein n=1 Tax=Tribonema minus TaxID=303371 RepID=A0A835YR18_9STRA|nr:hypothetical protein JKP88DRAFT_250577 [Tribonema minus]
MSKNVATIQAIYAAFARGDLETLKSHLADDVTFDDRESYGIPLIAPRRGPDEAVAAFTTFRDNVDIVSSRIVKFLEGGDTVIAWADSTFVWRATGRRFSDAYNMNVFEFNADGKVALDTHGLLLATDPSIGK